MFTDETIEGAPNETIWTQIVPLDYIDCMFRFVFIIIVIILIITVDTIFSMLIIIIITGYLIILQP